MMNKIKVKSLHNTMLNIVKCYVLYINLFNLKDENNDYCSL